jgi:predicted nucleotidyltransferase
VPESVIEWPGRDDLPGEREAVIVRNDRDPLFGMSREGFEARLREAVAGRALEAYIFGSYSTEAFGPDSDIDLIIVVRTDKAFVDRASEYYDLLDIIPSMDILVYTPEEFHDLTEDPTPGFWQSAVASLRKLDLTVKGRG